MGAKKDKATAFTLVLKPQDVRVRKAAAPPARPMDDKRRKKPRSRPDFLVAESLLDQ